MKTLGEIAYEAWWAELTGKPQTSEEWGDNPAWDAAAAAVSDAIFERLEAVLDEGDAGEETFEGPALDVRDFYSHLSETEVMDVYQAGCK